MIVCDVCNIMEPDFTCECCQTIEKTAVCSDCWEESKKDKQSVAYLIINEHQWRVSNR